MPYPSGRSTSSSPIKHRHYIFALTLSLVAMGSGPAWSRDVLILVENNLESPFPTALQSELIQGVTGSEHRIFVHEVPTDYEHLLVGPDPAITEHLAVELAARFSDDRTGGPVNFSEIIAQGTASGRFLDDIPQFYPEAERSFFQILWDPETGTRYPSDLDGGLTLQAIDALLPNTELVVLLHEMIPAPDETLTPLELTFEAAWSSRFSKRFDFQSVTLLQPAYKLMEFLETVPDNTVLVYAPFPDAQPTNVEFHYWLLHEDDYPRFGIFEHKMAGYVGGNYVSAYHLAQSMIAKAEQRQTRFSPTDVSETIVNYEQLVRWDIDPKRVPDDYVVRGAPDENFSRGFVMTLVAGSAAVILGLLTVLYLVTRSRLKVSQKFALEMTQLAQNEAKQRDNLRRIREASAIGEWVWDTATEAFAYDPVAADLLGYPLPSNPLDWTTATDWSGHVHPADLDELDNYIHCLVAGLKSSDLINRYLTPDGREVYVRHTGAVAEQDEFGNTVRLRGLLRDISDGQRERISSTDKIGQLRRDVQRLRKQAELAKTAAEISELGTLHWDLKNDTATASPRACDLFGFPEYAGKTIQGTFWFLDRVHPDDLERLKASVEKDLTSAQDTTVEVYRVAKGDGSYRRVRSKAVIYRDDMGQPLEAYGVISELSDTSTGFPS